MGFSCLCVRDGQWTFRATREEGWKDGTETVQGFLVLAWICGALDNEQSATSVFFLMRFMLTQTAQIYLLIGKIREHNRVNETSVSAAFYPSLFWSPLHPCLACFNQQKHNYHLGFIALTENIRKCWQRVCQCELRSVQIEEILFWHHGSVLYNVSPCEVLFTASENKMQREVSCTLELEPTKTQIT